MYYVKRTMNHWCLYIFTWRFQVLIVGVHVIPLVVKQNAYQLVSLLVGVYLLVCSDNVYEMLEVSKQDLTTHQYI